MTKYQVGDMFVATITEVDEQGMGIAYTLNDSLIAVESQLNNMEMFEPQPFTADDNANKQVYTPEDLLFRIEKLSNLLQVTIEKYIQIRKSLDVGVPSIDTQIEELSL